MLWRALAEVDKYGIRGSLWRERRASRQACWWVWICSTRRRCTAGVLGAAGGRAGRGQARGHRDQFPPVGCQRQSTWGGARPEPCPTLAKHHRLLSTPFPSWRISIPSLIRVPARSRFVWFVPPAALARSQVARSSACGVPRATGDQVEHSVLCRGPGQRTMPAPRKRRTPPAGHPERRHVASGNCGRPERTVAAPARRHVWLLTAAADTGEACGCWLAARNHL